VARGAFRIDLFYRIVVYPLRLPPLRARDGDIRVLTQAFLKRAYADYGMREPSIDPHVFDALEHHPFPGNVRELQNIVEALAIRSRGHSRVTSQHLEDVFQSQRLHTEPPRLGAAPGAAPVSAAAPGGSGLATGTGRAGRGGWPDARAGERPDATAGTPDAATVGARLLAAYRGARFNLLEASRQLQAGRLEGVGVAVADRAMLSHYLDGEILRAFLETGTVAATIERVAAGQGPRHRAETRVRRVLERLLEALDAGETTQAFPRLPREYHAALETLVQRGVAWTRAALTR
jgi:hypothetical protein